MVKNRIWSSCMLLAPLQISKTLPASGHDTGGQPKSSSSQPVPPCSPSPPPFSKVPPCCQLPSLLTSGISALSSLILSSQQSRSQHQQSISPFSLPLLVTLTLSAPMAGLPHLIFLAKNTTFKCLLPALVLQHSILEPACSGSSGPGSHPLYLPIFPPLPLTDI